MRIVRLTIHGRVQGVGYRAFVAGEADVCGLEGWVRNRRDGTVEAVIAGDPSLVEGLISCCRRGPPVSRIDSIDVEEVGEKELQRRNPGEKFSVLRTV